MKALRNLLLMLSVAALASASMAQGGGRQGGMRMFGGGGDSSGIMLLQRSDVQKDLNLSDDQKSKLDAMRTKMMEDMRAQFQNGGGGGDREAMMKAVQAMQENAKKETEKILTKEQVGRLKEINIQLAGNSAATWADVQKDLGLTSDQVTKIKDLQTKQGEANRALGQKMRNQELTMEEFQESIKKNTDTFNAELGKILTAENKAKLKTMGGKEFKADADR